MVVTWVAILAWTGRAALADRLVLTPVKDNTLIENISGVYSNALGDGIFSGRVGNFGNAQGERLRAVLEFDLSAIPGGATINSASLSLMLLQTISKLQTHTLHRVLAEWGEGTSTGTGGLGSPATDGDATWIHTFFPDSLWTDAGGDFDPTPSASLDVSGNPGPYFWSSAAMAGDVQGWLNDPDSNHGWLLKGNEKQIFTARKFASRENVNVAPPQLVIDYTPCPADIAPRGGNNFVNVDDLLAVINSWGNCLNPNDCPADIAPAGGNDAVNVDDLLFVINHWGACPQ